MTEVKQEVHKGKQQISISQNKMDSLQRITYEDIKNIQLKNEQFEKERRIKDEDQRIQRSNKILFEAQESNKQNAALEMKWADLKELEECEELNKEIQQQIELFKQIRLRKDSLIEELWVELRKKDDDYVKMLKEQSRDIETMIVKMRKQFFEMRAKYLTELEIIEDEFSSEREILLKKLEQRLTDLFEKHTNMEKQFVTARDVWEDDYAQKIEKLRIEGQNSYTQIKIMTETDIQNLEKCFEEVKALYQLNSEKLDYNLRVLRERRDENTQQTDELKRKEQNFSNRYSKLRKDFIESDRQYKIENKNISNEYKRITRQFQELQKKFKHFEKADLDRYNEIQKMNEADVQKLKEKILKCDQIIHIQQLGMPWSPPQEQEEKPVQQIDMTKNSKEIQEQTQNDFALEVNDKQLETYVDILLHETNFLLDDKISQQIQESSKTEQLLLKVDTLKKCLQIDSVDEFNILINEIHKKYQLFQQEEMTILQQNILDDSDLNNDQKLQEESFTENENLEHINNNIMVMLHDFLNNKDTRKKLLEQTSSKRAAKIETAREQKERIAREGKKYWEKLTQVLPEKTFRVWKMLDVALSQYYKILLERQSLIEETGDLHNQNEELKNLLNQYLHINHELIIPPTKLIKLDQV